MQSRRDSAFRNVEQLRNGAAIEFLEFKQHKHLALMKRKREHDVSDLGTAFALLHDVFCTVTRVCRLGGH